MIWLLGSLALSWFVANFGTYNATYGSLGAVIGFMIWLWLSTIVVLLGGEINAEMEHQTAQDTTEGRRKPLGARGAPDGGSCRLFIKKRSDELRADPANELMPPSPIITKSAMVSLL